MTKLRPHQLTLLLKILKTLSKEPKNTLTIYREIYQNTGFRNHHSFYRQLNFCLENNLIELAKVSKKWGIPTKTYRITKKGENLLQLFKQKEAQL
jgi:DNA-binding PadR family transcriptional regulator